MNSSASRAEGPGPAADPILCQVCGRPIHRGEYHRSRIFWTPEGPPGAAHNVCLAVFDDIGGLLRAEGLIR